MPCSGSEVDNGIDLQLFGVWGAAAGICLIWGRRCSGIGLTVHRYDEPFDRPLGKQFVRPFVCFECA
jgi:hypothetical protein